MLGALIICNVIAASCLVLGPDSVVLFWLAISLGSFSAAFSYWRTISLSQSISLPHAMVSALGGGYCISTLGVGVGSGLISTADLVMSPGYLAMQSPDSVAYALALVLYAIAANLLLAVVVPRIDTSAWRSTLSRRSFWTLIGLLASACVLSFATGGMGYMGLSSSDGQISAAAAILSIALPVITALACYKGLSERRFLWIFLATILVLLSAITGRRNLIFTLTLVPVVFAAVGRPTSLRSIARLTPILLVSGSVIAILLQFFVAMRIAGWGAADTLSLLDRASKATTIMIGDDSVKIDQYLKDTSSGRSLILLYPAAFITSADYGGRLPLYGEGLLVSIGQATPALLLPNKRDLVPEAIETITHPRAGIAIFDGPNTILEAGLVDFWWVGAILYPVLKTLLMLGVVKAFRSKSKGAAVDVVIVLASFFSVLQIEASLFSLFALVRNIAILWLVLSIYTWIKLPRHLMKSNTLARRSAASR